MSWGFEIGRTYNRRRDIHDRFGGQRQGGIITPANHSVVIIITGEEGLEHGYKDGYRDDGIFEYFGEGQLGDMRMRAGNTHIAEHSINGRSLLLFQKTKSGVKFVGEMVCEDYKTRRAPDNAGAMRDAIVFELRALDSVNDRIASEKFPNAIDLLQLRAQAIAASSLSVDAKKQNRNVYERSIDVRNYVLARANGRCEGCDTKAPFFRADGSPYLEPHHLLRLTDGGPDHPIYVIGLCPNCHRRTHHGADGPEYNADLKEKLTVKEAAIAEPA